MTNDILGRASSAVDGHTGGPLWYVDQAGLYPVVPVGIVLAALIAWRGAVARPLAGLVAIAMAVYLFVISLAVSKLPWYVVPLVPLAGLSCGSPSRSCAGWSRASTSCPAGWSMACSSWPAIGAIVLLSRSAAHVVDVVADVYASTEEHAYDVFLRSPGFPATDDALVIVHPGFPAGSPYYAPVRFYALGLYGQRVRAS